MHIFFVIYHFASIILRVVIIYCPFLTPSGLNMTGSMYLFHHLDCMLYFTVAQL